MKPKNKFQLQIVKASRTLPKITATQLRWAYDHCFEYIGRRSAKGVITCARCGHSWQGDSHLIDTLAGNVCPNCATELKVETTRRRNFSDYEYLCIVTTCRGYQVLRFVYIEMTAKAGAPAKYYTQEVVQRWIAPDGRNAVLAKLRPMGYFVHGWSWHSALEIRPDKPLYNINPTQIYPRQRLIPEVKRTGYKTPVEGMTPFDTIHTLLSIPKTETLLKTEQNVLFRYFACHSGTIDQYWPSVRIAIRNGYTVKEANEWIDYIDLLRMFGKDIHNAKYVCPADLKAEHDRYLARRQAERERERLEHQRAKALENEREFKELKGKFFGIEFSDGHISVRVLDSVEDIMLEGNAMHHCVFTNNYHLRPDSLILSATVDGKRIETVEVSLSKLSVIQCRGACNKNTKYHSQIVELVGRNMPLIEQRLTA